MPLAGTAAPLRRQAGAHRILVVEDEPDVANLIKLTLERAGNATVDIVGPADAALRAVRGAPPDLLILDLNLPGFDGTELCRFLRRQPDTAALPIIIVTARAGETDRVSGLDVGADDYVTKPFSPKELAARVRAVLRRGRQIAAAAATPVYEDRHLTADFESVIVTIDQQPIQLTRREFELLRCLVENRGRVLSRTRLLDRVWGVDGSIETRSVDVHIGRLRSKLGPAGEQIQTVVGLGYRFVEVPK